MKSTLNIALIQLDIIWHNEKANIQKVEKMLDEIVHADLIILPETWSTGFSMQPNEVSNNMDSALINRMKQWAQEKSAAIISSMVIKEGNHYCNRLLLVDKDGPQAMYDKRHLFSLAGEEKVYSAGEKQGLASYKTWQLNLNICYDLRFPVWTRNTTSYHLLIYVANWPKARQHAWSILLQARAIENQCFVIGCNRVGSDPNNLQYMGGSAVIDYIGKHLIELDDQEQIAQSTIDMDALLRFREKFNFLRDRDDFEFK